MGVGGSWLTPDSGVVGLWKFGGDDWPGVPLLLLMKAGGADEDGEDYETRRLVR